MIQNAQKIWDMATRQPHGHGPYATESNPNPTKLHEKQVRLLFLAAPAAVTAVCDDELCDSCPGYARVATRDEGNIFHG